MKRADLQVGVVYAYARSAQYDTPKPCIVLDLTPDAWEGRRWSDAREDAPLFHRPERPPFKGKGMFAAAMPTSQAPDAPWGPCLVHPRQLIGEYHAVVAERTAEETARRAARQREEERKRALQMRAGEVESALAEALGVLGPKVIVATDQYDRQVVIKLLDDDAIDRVRDALLRCALQESSA